MRPARLVSFLRKGAPALPQCAEVCSRGLSIFARRTAESGSQPADVFSLDQTEQSVGVKILLTVLHHQTEVGCCQHRI